METKTSIDLELMTTAMQRAQKQDSLFASALKKLVSSSEEEILQFLGRGWDSNKKAFRLLKKITSDISLESTAFFDVRDFFKTKNEGGIFTCVDSDIFGWLETRIKNSPAKKLASHEFVEKITEKNVVASAKVGRVYEEVDMAHVKQVCEKHIIKGEKLLKDDGSSNLFWVRNKNGDLCRVSVFWHRGWYVSLHEFNPSFDWHAGNRSFFCG